MNHANSFGFEKRCFKSVVIRWHPHKDTNIVVLTYSRQRWRQDRTVGSPASSNVSKAEAHRMVFLLFGRRQGKGSIERIRSRVGLLSQEEPPSLFCRLQCAGIVTNRFAGLSGASSECRKCPRFIHGPLMFQFRTRSHFEHRWSSGQCSLCYCIACLLMIK